MSFENNLLIYHIPEIPDPSDPKYQRLACSNVKSTIVIGCEHLSRNVANMLPGCCSAEFRFIFEPEGHGQDSQSRLNLYLLLWASSSTVASNLDALVRGGPLSNFYNFVKVEKLPKTRMELFSSCEIVRRENFIMPLYTSDLNYNIPQSYYTIDSLVPNKENDYFLLDRILDRATESVIICIKIQSADTSKQLHAHAKYMAQLTEITRYLDYCDDDFGSCDYTGSNDYNYVPLRDQLRPLAYKDPLANDVLRAEREIHKLLFKPLLFFKITVAAATEHTAHLVCSVLAESAFEEGGYRIIINDYNTNPIDESGQSYQASQIDCHHMPQHANEKEPSEDYKNLWALARLATVEELSGAFRLLVASSQPLCCRKNTDPPSVDPKNLILLGYDSQGSGDFVSNIQRGILFNILRKHLSSFGLPGSGKTTGNIHLLSQLSSRGIPFLVFECSKREYRVLKMLKEQDDPCFRELAQKIEIYTPGVEKLSSFRFNPFELLRGIEVVEHIENLRSCFKAAIPISAGSLPALIGEALEELYERYPDPEHPPVMTDLIAIVDKILSTKGYSSGTRSDMQTAMEVRLGILAQLVIGTIFQCRHGISIEHLMSVPSIIELDGLPADQARLLTLFILNGIKEYLRTVPVPSEGLRYAILIEETHVIFGSRKSTTGSDEIADTQSSIADFISRMLVEFRSLGVGIILSDQHPTALDASAYQSVGSILAYRQTYGPDREELSRSMLLNNSQEQDIARLPPGKAFFFTEGYFEPRLIRTPNLNDRLRLTPPPTNEELLKAICKEDWFQSIREQRISDELGQLKEHVDKYDELRLVISNWVKKLLEVYNVLLDQKHNKLRNQRFVNIVRELRVLKEKLISSSNQFNKGPYRRFSKLITPDCEFPEKDLDALAESLRRRYQIVLESSTQGLLHVIERLIKNCMKQKIKETNHAKKK